MSKKSNKLEQDQEKQINSLNEGFMSRLMKKILTKRFAKVAKIAAKDPVFKASYDEWAKATDDLLSTLKGTSKGMRRHRSAKVQKAISKPGKARDKAIRDLGKELGYFD